MPVPKPKLDPDVEAFYKQLLEKGGLSPEETDLLHTLLSNEKVATEFKVGVNARSLTDRKLDEFKKEQKRIETDYSKKVSDLNALQQTLATTSSSDKTKIATLERAIKIQEDKINVVRKTALEYDDGKDFLAKVGLDRDDYTSSYSTPPTPENKPSFSKDDITKEFYTALSTNTKALAKFQFDLLRMRDEYKTLSGKDLNLEEFYNELENNIDDYNGDYNKLFTEKYDIVNLRKKRDEDSFNARVDKEVADRLEKERAKLLIPSERVAASQSDFFKAIESTIPEKEREEAKSNNPLGIADRGSVINEAVQHFQNLRNQKDQAST